MQIAEKWVILYLLDSFLFSNHKRCLYIYYFLSQHDYMCTNRTLYIGPASSTCIHIIRGVQIFKVLKSEFFINRSDNAHRQDIPATWRTGKATVVIQ